MLDIMESNVQRGAGMVKQVLTFGRGVKGDRVLLQVKTSRWKSNRWSRALSPNHRVPMESARRPVDGDLRSDPDPSGVVESVRQRARRHARRRHIDAQIEEPCARRSPSPRINLDASPALMSSSGSRIPGREYPRKIGAHIRSVFHDQGCRKGHRAGLVHHPGHRPKPQRLHPLLQHGRQGQHLQSVSSRRVASAATEGAPAEYVQLPNGHQELVLVVDDEAPIREVARQILERFGYRVLLAVNGVEAVQLSPPARMKSPWSSPTWPCRSWTDTPPSPRCGPSIPKSRSSAPAAWT